jgi:hypothetical protein
VFSISEEVFSMKKRLTPLQERSRAAAFPSGVPSHATAPARYILSPTAVLPAQFFPPADRSGKGEVALMRAVLEEAMDCFRRQFAVRDPRTLRLAQEAEEWLFADEERWPFSFLNICAALEIDPHYLRRGLRQWRQQPPPQIPAGSSTWCFALILSVLPRKRRSTAVRCRAALGSGYH